MADQLVLDYDQALEAGTERVGGKGWNLGRLHKFGFPVPRGGVLVADVYREYMREPEIADQLAKLTAVTPEAVDRPEVAEALAAVRERILSTPLPEAAVDEIRTFLARIELAESPIAVRSSATAEDGARTSFAGIHESRLNVLGLDATAQAIQECYASLWTPRALAYRRRFGQSDDEVACAVVLCAMVRGPDGGPLAAAGVAFSCDPLTGQRDVVRISAVPELGESLVSGGANPENWTLRLERFRFLATHREQIGAPVLTEEQAVELAILTGRVHWALGDGQDPQDVEWAFDGQSFWLVQARPVTRVPRRTAPAVRDLPIIWSNGNLKDVIPGVPSTTAWEGTQAVVRTILLANIEITGYPVPTGMEILRRIEGRAYFDLTTVQWFYYDAMGLMPADLNASLGGSQPEIPVPRGKPMDGRAGRRRQLGALRLLRAFWQNSRTLRSEMDRIRGLTRSWATMPLAGLSSSELIGLLRDLSDVSLPFARQFQLANGSTLWYGLLQSTLERFRPGESSRLMSALMAGGGSVVSANHGYRIRDLALAAERDSAARAWIECEQRDPHGWLALHEDSPFRRELSRFIDEFGHRGLYELDLANPRWNEDPSYIVDQVQQLLRVGTSDSPQANAHARRRGAEVEVDRLPLMARPVVRWLAERARQASADREESKSVLVSFLEPMRKVALEAGRRMEKAGLIDDVTDVFQLTWLDVSAYLLGYWDGQGARSLIQYRVEQRVRWLQMNPPDTIILDAEGNPATLPVTAVQPGERAAGVPLLTSADAIVMTGVPAAAGQATGLARIIHHPNEGHRLQPGDVLVAPSTDPGWTPLFLRASAIVMEVGGYISHGAIVAREYGIPAVVNVPGALSLLHDGEMVTVDGDAGRVIKASVPTPAA